MTRTAEKVWSASKAAYVSVDAELLRTNNESALLAQRKLFNLLSADMPNSTDYQITLLKQFWPSMEAAMLELSPRFEIMWALHDIDLGLARHLEYWRMSAKYKTVLDFPSQCALGAGLDVYELGERNPLKKQHITRDYFETQAAVYDVNVGMMFSRMLTFLYHYEMFAPAIATEAAYYLPDHMSPENVQDLLGVFNDVLDTLALYKP